MTLNGIEHTKISGPIIISVCCVCCHVIGVKSAEGAAPSLSHGYCQPCIDKIRRKNK